MKRWQNIPVKKFKMMLDLFLVTRYNIEVLEASESCRVAKWDHSSAGRASALQAEGHRFEPYWSHFKLNMAK